MEKRGRSERRVAPAVAAAVLAALLAGCGGSASQSTSGPSSSASPDPGKTVGPQIKGSGAFVGYTLLAPKHYTTTYLIDVSGQVVHTWKSAYVPGQSAYLLPNGNLLRAARPPGRTTGDTTGTRSSRSAGTPPATPASRDAT